MMGWGFEKEKLDEAKIAKSKEMGRLAKRGFFDRDRVIAEFRKAGTIFEGHIERGVPGVEWDSGNLGQGLSAGCGFALAARLHNKNYQVFVAMGDGEQSKGQISEARLEKVHRKLTKNTYGGASLDDF